MFTMRICNVDAVLVAHGDGHQQEDWNRTLVRLLRGALPPGSRSRQVIHARLLDGRPGDATTVVNASFTDGAGNVHYDLALTVHTDPPLRDDDRPPGPGMGLSGVDDELPRVEDNPSRSGAVSR